MGPQGNGDAIMRIASAIAAHPELQMALKGVAGNTSVAQRLASSAPAPMPTGDAPQSVPVPGQTAQAVITPDRIAEAFQSMGLSPNGEQMDSRIGAADAMRIDPATAAELQRRAGFAGQEQAGAPNAGFVGDIMSTMHGANGEQPQQAPSEGGMLDKFLPEGIRNPLVDALSALAVGNPNAPPMQAFGQGFLGAQTSAQNRMDRKRADQAATAEAEWRREGRAHDWARDSAQDEHTAATDAREEKRLSYEERRQDREDQAAQIDEIRQRAGIEHTIEETKKLQREYKRQGYSLDEVVKMENAASEHVRSLFGNRYGESFDAVGAKAEYDRFMEELKHNNPAGGEGITVVPKRQDRMPQEQPPVAPPAEAAPGDVEGSIAPASAPPSTDVASAPQGAGTIAEPMVFPPNATAEEAHGVLAALAKSMGGPVHFRDENGALREFAIA